MKPSGSSAVCISTLPRRSGKSTRAASGMGCRPCSSWPTWAVSLFRSCVRTESMWTPPIGGVLQEGGASVAHNPSSNLKLANGIAPVQTLLDQGINVSLGTDGPASNDNLNLFEEMHLAALLQKWLRRDAEALPARQVLRMATIHGAKALGLDARIGSLEVGKQADLIVIDVARPHLVPRHDPVALLVYSAQAADVCVVLVDGRILLDDRRSPPSTRPLFWPRRRADGVRCTSARRVAERRPPT